MEKSSEFAINGRFLTQPTTGVQRYAHNVTYQMNEILVHNQKEAIIISPAGSKDPKMPAIPLRAIGKMNGHAWEQITLPKTHRGNLLNLCNTAPIFKSNQVVCMHDANIFESPDSYGFYFRNTYKNLQPLIVRNSAIITTVSHASALQICRHLTIRLSDIRVLPNGHEHALQWQASQALVARSIIEKIRMRSRRGFIFAIGSRAKHKNIKLLLEIAKDLDDLAIDIVIAGGGFNIYTKENFEKPSNSYLVDSITDNDIACFMDNAICLAFPSFTEGFGLPIVEAMARGCPVISSDWASMPEVCGNAALMAPPNDPQAWVKHVKALVNSNDLRYELIGRGHERANHYSWRNTAKGYIDLMNSLDSNNALSDIKPSQALPSISVIVATTGRRDIVDQTIKYLSETQSLKPKEIIISCVREEDVGEISKMDGIKILIGKAGLPAQRNKALKSVSADTKIVVFFDDDFVAHRDWLKVCAETFRDSSEIVSFTGDVLVDDIKGPGLEFEEAKRIVEAAVLPSPHILTERYSPYGCNMAFRQSAISELFFDEKLVLYGWLEDRDFGSSLSHRGGRLVKTTGAQGVHMGVKRGRVAGERLGYSQVINPTYMLIKGTISIGQFASHLFRNISSNLLGSINPEPFVDRRGRIRGNIRGIMDLMRMRCDPRQAEMISWKAERK